MRWRMQGNRARPQMLTDRFLLNRRGVSLQTEERDLLESSISQVRKLKARTTLVHAGEALAISTLLVEGMMSRYIDDHKGLRQLVAVHVAGEFVDLHAYPMHRLDHSIGTLTSATIAIIPHEALRRILAGREEFARKLWFSTLLDAALHRAWLFRLGRLDGVGRVAHFLCETNARLQAVGLSDGRRFALNLTQTDIAEVCGLTTVHTNRAIRHLRETNMCLVKASFVDIVDAAGLARRGDFDPGYLYLNTASQ